MRRLEEEDAAKSELEEDKRNLQAELLEEKRRSKISLSELKTKVIYTITAFSLFFFHLLFCICFSLMFHLFLFVFNYFCSWTWHLMREDN